MTEAELLLHIKATAKPQGAWGKKHGFAQSVISNVVTGRVQPSEAFLKALGLKRIVTFEPIKKPRP